MKFLIVTFFLIGCTVAQFGAPYRGGFRRPGQQTPYQPQQPQFQPQQPQYQPDLGFRPNGPQIEIRSQTQDSSPDGSYRYSYEAANGISVSEEGSPQAAGPEGPAVVARGSYSYTGPDGVVYTVEYIADENGYRASGAHLPQSPPIPEAIARAVASLPPSNEGQYVEEPYNRNFNQNKNNYRRF